MIWEIEEVKQVFSEIIKASGSTPQVIYQCCQFLKGE
jgi:hypothetical protein